MRFRFIDIEATAEELKANKTIVDVVREAMLQCIYVNDEDDDEEATDEAD